MAAMRKGWWYFRLAVFAFTATGLGIYLFHSTPWRKALGIQADYRQQMAEGDRMMAAIYAFQYDTALWPQYLDDLKVGPLQYRWFYEVQPLADGHRQPALSMEAPAEGGRGHLAFVFGPDRVNGDWHVFTSTADRVERAGSHLPSSRAPLTRSFRGPPPPGVTIAELDRRIGREPGRIEHYQDKASLLVFGGQYGDARVVISGGAAQFPGSAWPRLAVALDQFEDSTGAEPESVRAFAALAAKPSLTRCFGLAWLYRQAGEDLQVRIAMARAIEQPPEVDADDSRTAAFYLYDMARWALETGNWNLAVDICNAWEKGAEQELVRDRSYLVVRAAAEVALGKFGEAQGDLAKFRGLKAADAPAWIRAAGEGMNLLEAAAAKSNPAVRLVFPPIPGGYQPFIAPE